MRHDHNLPDSLRCSELHDFSDLSMPALGVAYRRLVRKGLAVGAGLGGLLAAALFLGVFDGGLPKPARAEAAASVVLAAGSGPARPSAPGLCFHGPGGELVGFAPTGQHCR